MALAWWTYYYKKRLKRCCSPGLDDAPRRIRSTQFSYPRIPRQRSLMVTVHVVTSRHKHLPNYQLLTCAVLETGKSLIKSIISKSSRSRDIFFLCFMLKDIYIPNWCSMACQILSWPRKTTDSQNKGLHITPGGYHYCGGPGLSVLQLATPITSWECWATTYDLHIWIPWGQVPPIPFGQQNA